MKSITHGKRIWMTMALAAFSAVAFGGERLVPGQEARVLSQPGIWSHRPNAIKGTPSGEGAWRLVHTGDLDWAFNPVSRFDVKPGETFEMTATCEVTKGAPRGGCAEVCAALFDAKGGAVHWTWGAASLKPNATATIRFMIPEGVSCIQPRVIGAGAFDAIVKNIRFRALKPIPPSNLSRENLSLASPSLSLSLDAANGALSVADRRTGRTWSAQSKASAGVLVAAEKVEGALVATILDPQTLVRFRAVYRLEREKPEFVVEIKGEGPLAKALEYPAAFGTRAGDRIVIPQNEGVSFPVEEPHPVGTTYQAWCGHGLCMAFFGVTEDASGAGWMTILETEADASMRTHRDRKGVLSAGPAWDPEFGKFGYPRRARYVFFERGGHVAMCKRYRAYAKEIGRWKPFSEKVKARPILDRLFGAINVWCWEGRQGSWVADLQAAGIRRILWSGGGNPDEVRKLAANPEVLVGRYDIYTDVYHPEQLRKLGRKGGCNSEAWPNDVIWSGPTSNDWTRAWGVKAKDGTWTHCATLCDMISPDYCRRNIANDLKTKPYNARFLDVTTAGTWKECWNPRHPMNRRESRAARERLLNVVSGEFGLVTGGETGHDFSVPFCDYYEGMLSLCSYRVPDSGRNIQQIWTNAPANVAKYQVGEKYRLPLWELVYHDCTCAEWYWGDYNNKLPELWGKRDLFNVLYGTMGMFFVSRHQWKTHRDDFVRSYRITSPVARATAKSEMTDHRFLTPDRSVQRTTFANGVSVTVNFGDALWRDADGAVLPPKTHRVTGL